MTEDAAKTIRTIWWEGEVDGVVRLIEQTLLPGTLLEIDSSILCSAELGVCQPTEIIAPRIRAIQVNGLG